MLLDILGAVAFYIVAALAIALLVLFFRAFASKAPALLLVVFIVVGLIVMR